MKCVFPIRRLHVGVTSKDVLMRHCIKCKKDDDADADASEVSSKKDGQGYEYVSVERAPYYSYMDSTSGKMEPASGARASIPGEDYWPEGTSSRVRAARAPQPAGESSSFPSYGKNPGSRRKKNRKATEGSAAVETYDEVSDSEDSSEEEENDLSNGFVVYDNGVEGGEEEEEAGFELDKKLGRPHPFIDPTKKKQIEKTLTNDESWWNWRKPEKEQWSRWQRRRPDVETVRAHYSDDNTCCLLVFSS